AGGLAPLWWASLLALCLVELFFLVRYVIDCATIREKVLGSVTFGLAGLWLAGGLYGAHLTARAVRFAAERQMSRNNLRQIALAVQSYHDAHDSFPQHAIYGRDGR